MCAHNGVVLVAVPITARNLWPLTFHCSTFALDPTEQLDATRHVSARIGADRTDTAPAASVKSFRRRISPAAYRAGQRGSTGFIRLAGFGAEARSAPRAHGSTSLGRL